MRKNRKKSRNKPILLFVHFALFCSTFGLAQNGWPWYTDGIVSVEEETLLSETHVNRTRT